MTAASFPWLALAWMGPAVAAGLGARWPQRTTPLSALGMLLMVLAIARIRLGFDAAAGGYQFAVSATMAVDGWSLPALVMLASIGGVAAIHQWTRPARLPAILGVTAAGIFAVTALDAAMAVGGVLGALTILRLDGEDSLNAWDLGLGAMALAGVALQQAAPMFAFPLLFVGMGGLAGAVPASGSAHAMLLRAGVVAPAAVLQVARLGFLALPEAALIWTQATATLAVVGALAAGIAALRAETPLQLAGAMVGCTVAIALVAWGGTRIVAWNGAVLLALSIGVSAGLAAIAAAGIEDDRWRRLRGAPRRGMLFALSGLAIAGMPLTPGFSGMALVALGTWQSPWWQAPWWIAGCVLGAWMCALAAVRVAVALRRDGPPPEAPMGPGAGILLVGCVLIGLAPRVILDRADPRTAALLPEMLPAIADLVDGVLSRQLPDWLRGWWL